MSKKNKLYYSDGFETTVRRLDKKPNSFNFIANNWEVIVNSHKTINKVSKSIFNIPGVVTVSLTQFKDLLKDLELKRDTGMISIFYNSTNKALVNIRIKDDKEDEGEEDIKANS